MIIYLNGEVEKLQKPEFQEQFLSDLAKEIEFKIVKEKQNEHEEMLKNLLDLEKDHLGIKGYVQTLQDHLRKKDMQIECYIKEIAEGKLKLIHYTAKYQKSKEKYKSLKEKYSYKVQFEMVDKELLLRYTHGQVLPNPDDKAMLSYAICLAAALEDFLV